jgi:superfamily II DNA or RNA helicase
MDKPTSFSQNKMFTECPRTWYYKYIKKVPTVEDLVYANGGSCIHDAIEFYFTNNATIEATKEVFKKEWAKYKLADTILKYKEDIYWNMVLTAINLPFKPTSCEMKIFFSDVVAYLDAVNTTTDHIVDWKSSTRGEWNEEEYKLQLQFYCYLYQRKFGRLPKLAEVYYLKYTDNKISFIPTEEDVRIAREWHEGVRVKMQHYIDHPEELPPFNENYTWSPYKVLWDSERGDKIKWILHITGNFIKVEGPIPDLLLKQLKRKFGYELKSAYFIKKAKPWARTRVDFWEDKQRRLPIGFKDELVKTLRDYAEYKKLLPAIDIVDHRIFDTTNIPMPEAFINGKVLRNYQVDAADTFIRRSNISILEIGTGGGKTEIAIECIRQLGFKTLFIVDKIELLRQTKKRIEDSLGISVGVIGAGEDDIKDVTVATVQTLAKHVQQYEAYLKSVRFAIFDETHKVAAASYFKIAKWLTNTEYRLGISGTAYRDDGNDMMINAVVGYKSYDLSSKVLIENGWLMRPRIQFIRDFCDEEEVKKKEKSLKEGLINESPDYAKWYGTFISENQERNNLLQEIVEKHRGKKILILTKLIAHGVYLKQVIPKSEHLYGDTKKEEREKIFEAFTSGSLDVLISTISIFAEGIDIPKLDMVINAAANKGDVKTIQVLGRVLRKLEGKSNAYYIDFHDVTKFFALASSSRKKALRNEGHNVELISIEEWRRE